MGEGVSCWTNRLLVGCGLRDDDHDIIWRSCWGLQRGAEGGGDEILYWRLLEMRCTIDAAANAAIPNSSQNVANNKKNKLYPERMNPPSSEQKIELRNFN
jgi:hypothetical protein